MMDFVALFGRRASVSSVRRGARSRRPPTAALECLEDRLLLTDPVLALSFSRYSIQESGWTTIGTVTRSDADLTEAVVVSLSSSDMTELTLPATVTIAAGETSATFTATAVDDALLDGTQDVLVTATATLTPVEGGSFEATALQLIAVTDYETLSLLRLGGGDTLGYGDSRTIRVTRSNTDIANPLTVTIENYDPSELITPRTVTIAAGAQFAHFTARFVDNNVPDGTRPIRLTLRANGYQNSSMDLTLNEVGTRTVSVAADGSVNGSTVDSTATSARVDPTRRGVFEFNTSTYSGRRIDAVALTLDPATLQYFAGDVFRFDVYAYAGDGTITAADAQQTGTKVGEFSLDSVNVYDMLGIKAIPLNIAAIQSLLDSGDAIGFVVVYTGQGTYATFNSAEATIGGEPNKPRLNIFFENHAPVIAQDNYTFTVAENPSGVVTVGSVGSTDPDAGDTRRYSIVAGNIGGAFSINAITGVISTASTTAIDYETNPQFALTVHVTDDGRGQLYDEATVTINVTNVPAPNVTQIWFGYGNNRWIPAEQLTGRTAPWRITAVRLMFDRPPTVDIDDLKVTGADGVEHAFSSFTVGASAPLYTWTLATPITRDALSFTLDGDGVTSDNQPDFERNIGVNYQGEYLAGGDYHFGLNVLYGDVNGDGAVNLLDALILRTRNTTTDVWADLNGDGVVSLLDALLLRTRNGATLP